MNNIPGSKLDSVYQYKRTYWKAIDWLYPPRCAGCNRLGFRWCASCSEDAPPLINNICQRCGDIGAFNKYCDKCNNNSSEITQARSYSELTGKLRDAILALKYHQNFSLGERLSEYLINMLLVLDWNVDIIVPVPLANIRLDARGYNQAEALSRPLAWHYKIPHFSNGLERIKETISQVGLSRDERMLNVQDAFIANPDIVGGKNVLLIDDVITTGATINACAKALKKQNVNQVYAISIARTSNILI